MLETGTTTLWESFEPSASLCHVFSAAPVYHLSRHVLGVQAIEKGFSSICIAPQFGNLENAEGIYPTPLGDINVAWVRGAHSIMFAISMPQEMEYEVKPPKGFSVADQNETQKESRRQVKITFA